MPDYQKPTPAELMRLADEPLRIFQQVAHVQDPLLHQLTAASARISIAIRILLQWLHLWSLPDESVLVVELTALMRALAAQASILDDHLAGLRALGAARDDQTRKITRFTKGVRSLKTSATNTLASHCRTLANLEDALAWYMRLPLISSATVRQTYLQKKPSSVQSLVSKGKAKAKVGKSKDAKEGSTDEAAPSEKLDLHHSSSEETLVATHGKDHGDAASLKSVQTLQSAWDTRSLVSTLPADVPEAHLSDNGNPLQKGALCLVQEPLWTEYLPNIAASQERWDVLQAALVEEPVGSDMWLKEHREYVILPKGRGKSTATETAARAPRALCPEDGTDQRPWKSWREQKFLQACRDGNADFAERLLKLEQSPNAREPSPSDDMRGASALHIAAHQGHVEVVQKLLTAGAYVHSTSTFDRTPLHSAAETGHIDLAQMLLDNNADVDRRDESGYTPLLVACRKGDAGMAELLLGAGADITRKGNDQFQALHHAAQDGRSVELIRVLLDHGALVDAEHPFRHTPLVMATRAGESDIVRSLLEHGHADPNIPLKSLPLNVAIREHRFDLVHLLVDAGATVHGIKGASSTPLVEAARLAQIPTLRFLLEHGCVVDDDDAIAACASAAPLPNPLSALRFLGEQRSSQLKSRPSMTMYHQVMTSRHLQSADQQHVVQVVHVLQSQGFDINGCDADGMTALDHAVKSREHWKVETLQQAGATRMQATTRVALAEWLQGTSRQGDDTQEVGVAR